MQYQELLASGKVKDERKKIAIQQVIDDLDSQLVHFEARPEF